MTMVFAGLLIVLGLAGYIGTGREHPTALIPTWFGIVFLLLGLAATNAKARKHAMHGAAALALIGFFGTIDGIIKTARMLTGAEIERPSAAVAKAIMSLLCLGFVGLCVRS